MEKTQKGKRPSEAQKGYLIDFLELNLDLAHDRFISVDGARAGENAWNNLAKEINGLGGANKDGTKWRKYWMDQKLYAKDRHAQLTAISNKSGVNGAKIPKPLTDNEERILAIMTPQAVDGDIHLLELGAHQNTPAESIEIIDVDNNVEYLISGASMSIPATTMLYDINLTPQIDNITTPIITRPSARKARKRAKPNSNEDEHLPKLIKLEEKKLELKLEKIQIEKEKLDIFKSILITLNEIKNKL